MLFNDKECNIAARAIRERSTRIGPAFSSDLKVAGRGAREAAVVQVKDTDTTVLQPFLQSNFKSIMPSLEICCFNSASAVNAHRAGATRIELCGETCSGGSTPDQDSFIQLRSIEKVTTPIYVMIRPRGGDFSYTAGEFQIMKNDIQKFKSHSTAKPEGFVFGILHDAKGVDMPLNTELVELARPFPATFHRAFDEIPEGKMEQALEDIIACGFSNILTSGGRDTAVQGVEILQSLVRKAEGRITIMPGGGVRLENIKFLVKETGATWFHSSGLVNGEKITVEDEIRKLLAGLSHM